MLLRTIAIVLLATSVLAQPTQQTCGGAATCGPAHVGGPTQVGFGGTGFGPAVQAFDTQTPSTSGTPATGYTVGGALQFPSSGQITQLWYYRYAAGMTTSRTLRLWAYAGGQVASAQTSGETGTGWISANLATPFAVTAGQQFIVSADIPANDSYGYKTIATTPSDTPFIVLIEGRYINAYQAFPSTKTATFLYFIDVSFQPVG